MHAKGEGKGVSLIEHGARYTGALPSREERAHTEKGAKDKGSAHGKVKSDGA